MKFLSARAGAAQSSIVFNCFGKGGTDQKDTEHILQHYKSRSVFSLHYFRKTFSTRFCIELTIASTCSILLIKSKSSMSWLTEPFDLYLRRFRTTLNPSFERKIFLLLLETDTLTVCSFDLIAREIFSESRKNLEAPQEM